MNRLAQIEAYAQAHLDVAVTDVIALVGCSKTRAGRLLRLLVEMRRLRRIGNGLFAYGDSERATARPERRRVRCRVSPKLSLERYFMGKRGRV